MPEELIKTPKYFFFSANWIRFGNSINQAIAVDEFQSDDEIRWAYPFLSDFLIIRLRFYDKATYLETINFLYKTENSDG